MKSVVVQLDRPRRLHFSKTSAGEITQYFHTARSPLEIREYGMIRDLLWFGLRHDDRKLTAVRVGELIEDSIAAGGTSLQEIMARINDALDIAIAEFIKEPPDGR